MTNRAIIYARKSIKDDHAAEQSASVSDQLARGRAYAAEHGWQVVSEHYDDGRSGLLDRSKRRGLDALLKQVENGEADTVVALWTSRISRDERQRAEILDIFDAFDVQWHAVADGGLIERDSYSGYMTYGVKTIFDVAHSKRVRETWKAAHQKRLENGLPKSSAPRFGYRYEFTMKDNGRRAGGAYVVHEDEAEVVRELYRRYIRGDGFSRLVSWLNSEGWRVAGTGKYAGQQNEWTVRTLNRFMDAGFAAGYISKQTGLRETYPGSHAALICEETWAAYRARRQQTSQLGKGAGARGRWWLGGLVKCGLCGGTTYVDSYERSNSLVCCATNRANRDACSGTSILRTTVEGAVGLWLGPHLDSLAVLSESETKATADAAAAAYGGAVAARDKIADGLADLLVKEALGDISPLVFGKARDELNARHTKAEAAVAEAAKNLHAPAVDPESLRSAADEGWTDEQRAALAQVLARVEVTKEALTIVPVTGGPATYTRSDLVPSCGVADCEKKQYTRGLCRMHVARARKVGGDDLLDALADRVTAEHQPSITNAEVETIFATATS